jgi:hypothetical protein
MCLIFVLSGVPADTINWNEGTTGEYSDDANWDLPRAPSDGDDVFIAGTGSVADYDLTGRHQPTSVTIGQGATLERTMSSAADLRASGTITNSGLLREAGGGEDFLLYQQTINNQSTGVVVADGTNASLYLLSTTVNNDNVVRLLNGARLLARNTVINGGTFQIDAASSMEIIQEEQTTVLSDVAVDNDGLISIEQTGASGERETVLEINGSTSFVNSTTANFTLNNTSTTPDHRDDQVETQVGGNATFTNNGSMTLRNESSRPAGSTTVSHTLMEVNTTTASFINAGTLSIEDASGVADNEVWLSSVSNVTNSGDVSLTGPQARLEVTGADYEQSGSSTTLADNAYLLADAININGGQLGGTGTIDGLLNFGDSATARMVIDGTGAGDFDQLSIVGDVAYDGTLEAVFAAEDLGRGFTFDLFDVTGTPSGDFDSVLDAGGFYSPDELVFDPATGDLTVLPEPGSCALVGIALLVILSGRAGHRSLS